MKCPECESSVLQIEVAFVGRITCRFHDEEDFEVADAASIDSDWNEDSDCRCLQCGWTGVVAEARREWSIAGSHSPSPSSAYAAQSAGSHVATGSRVSSIADVRQALSRETCDPLWQQCIDFLLAEVDRLNALLDTVKRMQSRENESGSGQETTLM